MIVFKHVSGKSVILGTYGEDVIVRGLKLVANDIGSSKAEVTEAYNLLKHLGRAELPHESDWDHSEI